MAGKEIQEWLDKSKDVFMQNFSLETDEILKLFKDVIVENPLPLFKALLLTEKMRSRTQCPDCSGTGKYEGRWDCLFCREADYTVATYEIPLRQAKRDDA